jgi:hypothetical protein
LFVTRIITILFIRILVLIEGREGDRSSSGFHDFDANLSVLDRVPPAQHNYFDWLYFWCWSYWSIEFTFIIVDQLLSYCWEWDENFRCWCVGGGPVWPGCMTSFCYFGFRWCFAVMSISISSYFVIWPISRWSRIDFWWAYIVDDI